MIINIYIIYEQIHTYIYNLLENKENKIHQLYLH